MAPWKPRLIVDAGFFWSDGWSWNASMPAGLWLPVAAIAALYIALGLIPYVENFAVRVQQIRSSSANVRTSSRSNTS